MDAAVSAEAAGSQAVERAQNRFGTTRRTICVCFLFFPNVDDQEGTRSYMTVTGIDNKVQRQAQAALAKSPFYELRELQVEQRDNGLLISGCVSRFYHKQLAQEAVRSVCADVTVINSIRVESEEDLR